LAESQPTADELENSFPMDIGRRFRNPADNALLSSILAGMRSKEHRTRARSAIAEKRWLASIEAMLANLTAAALNVMDANRYVAVSFDRNQYNDTELTLDALVQCRKHLKEQGLIEVARGFRRWDADGVGCFGRRTRLRATAKLREMIDRDGLRDRSVTQAPANLINLKGAKPDAGAEPGEVADSRPLLMAVNARLAKTEIAIHDSMWPFLSRKIVEDEGEDRDAAYRKRSYAGDLTAASLYRVFKYNWRSGGRIYGGWWMSLPRTARPYLTINGSPTVELDYKTLHPLLLYLRAGLPMPDDPYLVGQWKSQAMRDVGKRTFNRLLNRQIASAANWRNMLASPDDKEPLGQVPFKEYLAMFTHKHEALAPWLGIGAGLGLQYDDSVLALDVLRRMEDENVPVLPIHDSFIVQEEHEACLRLAMEAAFERYGIIPQIERKGPKSISA